MASNSSDSSAWPTRSQQHASREVTSALQFERQIPVMFWRSIPRAPLDLDARPSRHPDPNLSSDCSVHSRASSAQTPQRNVKSNSPQLGHSKSGSGTSSSLRGRRSEGQLLPVETTVVTSARDPTFNSEASPYGRNKSMHSLRVGKAKFGQSSDDDRRKGSDALDRDNSIETTSGAARRFLDALTIRRSRKPRPGIAKQDGSDRISKATDARRGGDVPSGSAVADSPTSSSQERVKMRDRRQEHGQVEHVQGQVQHTHDPKCRSQNRPVLNQTSEDSFELKNKSSGDESRLVRRALVDPEDPFTPQLVALPASPAPSKGPSFVSPPSLRSRRRSLPAHHEAPLDNSLPSVVSQSHSDPLDSRPTRKDVPGIVQKTQFGVTGLYNLGNTCYMASVLQCIAGTTPLASFFTGGQYLSELNEVNRFGTGGSLPKVLAELLYRLVTLETPAFNPQHFKNVFCASKPDFDTIDQYDAQEFLGYLLDGLHEDLNLVRDRPTRRALTTEDEDEIERLPEIIGAELEWRRGLEQDNSIIVDLFTGQFRSKLTCLTCRKTSSTFNPFTMLSVPLPVLPPDRPYLELAECINSLLSADVMQGDNAWNCPRCRRPRPATKWLSISRLPPVLIIHFKRFASIESVSEKVQTPVDFPLNELDLGELLPPIPPGTAEPPQHRLYELYAVINHYQTDSAGSSSGHYTAMIRYKDGWFEIDDEQVRRIGAREVEEAAESAYLLWYRAVPYT